MLPFPGRSEQRRMVPEPASIGADRWEGQFVGDQTTAQISECMRMTKAIHAVALAVISALFANGAVAQSATQDVNINATVPASCSIGGAASPAALNATVPVSPTGSVSTTAIPFTVNNVVCNTAANVQATSQGGGVKTGGTPPAGFSNIIDYTGSATFGGATSTVNTQDNPAATGAEAGNTGQTNGAASGSLSISVTPKTPSSPLIPGTYTDTLRVTITPN